MKNENDINGKIRRVSKKIKSINFLGGKCQNCGETDIFKLCFHHKDSNEKEKLISKLIYGKWSLLEKELNKCNLLCINCHNEIHHTNINSRFKNNKKMFLEFKNFFGCEICCYNNCDDSLHFHHENNKVFQIGRYKKTINTLNEFKNDIIEELNKCQIICGNCHNKIHSDVDFYKKYEKQIIDKVNGKSIGKYKSYNENEILLAYKDGMSRKNIQIKFECPKSTLSDMLKRNKLA